MTSEKRVHNPKLLFLYLCLLNIGLGMEAGGLQYNLLLISEELGLSSTQMGSIVSIQYMAFILIPLMFGGLGDRYGKKVILVSFGICFSLGCLAFIFSKSFLMVLASAFLVGAGYSICESTGASLMADIYHENASRYVNWSQSFFSSGALISPIFCQFLNNRLGFGWRSFFGILMIYYIMVAIWGYSLVFPLAPKQIVNKTSEKTTVPKKQMSGRLKVCILLLALGIMIYAGMETGIASFMGTHVSGVLGTEAYNSIALSLFWLMMIPSRYLVGLVKKYPKKILMMTYLGASIAIGVVIMIVTKNALLVTYACMGFFFAPVWPLIMGEAGNLDVENSARISGIMVAFCGIGGVVSPLLFGILADHVSIQASLLFVLGITAAGFVISVIYNIMSEKLVISSN